jgi:hypothetical protein
VQIEPPICQQYEPGNFLTVRSPHSDEIIDKDDDNETMADPGAPSGGGSCSGIGNDNENGKGEEDM